MASKRELEERIVKLIKENTLLTRGLKEEEELNAELRERLRGTPSDCKRGKYCAYCVYNKTVKYHSNIYTYRDHLIPARGQMATEHFYSYCSKDICPEFLPVKE